MEQFSYIVLYKRNNLGINMQSKTLRQSINDMFNENDALSLARVMTFLWFCLMVVTVLRITGRHHEMTEPVITAIFFFEGSTFALLLGYCFAGKTKLNYKNTKDGFELDRTGNEPSTPTPKL